MITVIDYGMGNLRSVQKAFEFLGHSAQVTSDPRKVEEADKLVLPGVGAFKDCMEELTQRELIGPIQNAIQRQKPFFGICLGMQVLFSESEEFGLHKGLNVIPGKVVHFPSPLKDPETQAALAVPHMGWNQIQKKKAHPFFKAIPEETAFYFVHSFYVIPKDSKTVAATTRYGVNFCSAVSRENVFATQFHPEKSQEAGLKLLQAFAEL